MYKQYVVSLYSFSIFIFCINVLYLANKFEYDYDYEGFMAERSIPKGVLKALGNVVHCLEMVCP